MASCIAQPARKRAEPRDKPDLSKPRPEASGRYG